MYASMSNRDAGPSHAPNPNTCCGFCQEWFRDSNEPSKMTRCGHRLHVHCMNQYLPQTKKCPICDYSIPNWKDITNKCVVCLDDLFNQDGVLETKCKHLYHENCIRNYLDCRNRCPICRRDISYVREDLDQLDNDNESQSDNQSFNSFEGESEDSSEEENCENTCAVCEGRFVADTRPTRRTRCGHLLHVHCMNAYLPEAKKCPVCGCKIKWIDVSNKCVVCFDVFTTSEAKKALPCRHESHADCLEQWTTSKKNCPICRCPLNVTPEVKECSICLENISRNDMKALKCRHEFHVNCVNSWLQNEQTCPLCRITV